jgi:predicted nucleic acid-binding Zn ribbon protein
VRLDEGVLTVRVDDPSWATQMRLLEHDVRARVKAACGVDLVRVEVRVERADRRR